MEKYNINKWLSVGIELLSSLDAQGNSWLYYTQELLLAGMGSTAGSVFALHMTNWGSILSIPNCPLSITGIIPELRARNAALLDMF